MFWARAAFGALGVASIALPLVGEGFWVRLAIGGIQCLACIVLMAVAVHPERAFETALAEEVPAVDPLIKIADLRARMAAARQVGDPNQVLDHRDELSPLLAESERRVLDKQTLAWLMTLLQKRLRSGTVRADVAELAGRAADRFGDTVEGASLRASLPVLRRAAGLCVRCGKPYAGVSESCGECSAAGRG